MFADDCLLYSEILCINDTKAFQDDVDSLQAWERNWLMEFNPSKCEDVTFTKKTMPIEMKYKLCNTTLAAVSSAKYFRVYIN